MNGKNISTLFLKQKGWYIIMKVLKDVCETCHRLKPQTYVREQQSFRCDTKVTLRELNKAVHFHHNDASGIPKYRKITV